jgi:hypothetical protein
MLLNEHVISLERIIFWNRESITLLEPTKQLKITLLKLKYYHLKYLGQ